MINIENSLDNLINSCEKFSICQSPDVKANTVLPDDKKGIISSAKELDLYFKNFKPHGEKIETGFTPIKLFSVDQLVRAQVGYEFLPEGYLVFADDNGGGKPIIAVLNEANVPVYANYDVGNPFIIADSLAEFFAALSKLIEVVYGDFNIFDIADDNDELKAEFIEKIKSQISPVLGNENYSAFFDYFYG